MRPATFTVALCMLSGVAMRVQAEAFAAADQALWIDRHNYFRMTALPFAAGNMLRIKWSDALATQAEADATACAAKTSAGVNAALVASTGSPVDAAFKTWVVDTAMTVFPTLAAPKVAGDPVGAGVYNSYSQVVWAATNEVGCAKATCGAQIGVACRYAPAGNDGTSPWYVHGSAGSACPSPLVSKVGLCVTSVDDPSYNPIAPIADGQNAYDVFKDFIPAMQKALQGQAQTAADASTAPVAPAAPAAPGASTATVTTAPAGSAAGAAATTAPAAAAGSASAAPGTATAAPGAAAAAPGAATTPAAPAANGTAEATTTAAPATGGATPAPMVTKIVDGKVYVRVPKTTAPAAGSGSAAAASETPAASAAATTDGSTPAPMVTKVVDGKVYVRVPKTTAPTAGAGSSAGATPSAGSAAAGATPEPSVTKVVDGKVYVRIKKTDNANDVVGTVQPSSGTGTTFTNQATTAPAAAASGAAASPTAASAKSTTATTSGPTAVGANNKSGDAEGEETKFSAAGVAGVIVIGAVAVAGLAVFVSYRKNQQRQRDIMQNGGIHVL